MKRSDFIKGGIISLFGFKSLGDYTKEEREESQPENSVKCIVKQDGKEFALGFMITNDADKNDKLTYYLHRATANQLRQKVN